MTGTGLWHRIFPPGADPFFTIVNLLIGLILLALTTAIVIDFMEARGPDQVAVEHRTVIATGSMSGFAIGFYLLLRFRVGTIAGVPVTTHKILAGIGLATILLGCLVNIQGRLDLGGNWGNQIRLYHDHTLVTDGAYRWVRHPLYASLIWMFYGASLVYLNMIALGSVTLVFIPIMTHRARREELLLLAEFPGYREYQKRVGMFLPRRFQGRAT
jgi:protein-S-isoprenylcysteine O-methyltransferase Ste14